MKVNQSQGIEMNPQTLNQTIKTLEGLRNAVGSFTRADVDLTLGLLRREVEASAQQPAPVQQEPDAIGCKCSECGAWQRWTPSGMVCKNGHGGAQGVNCQLYTRPQPAQQEPVAWRLWDEDPLGGTDNRWAYYDKSDFANGVDPTKHFKVEPLYTSPPAQRKPLTDAQIEKCFAESDGTFVSAARAIEAAHGIKENT